MKSDERYSQKPSLSGRQNPAVIDIELLGCDAGCGDTKRHHLTREQRKYESPRPETLPSRQHTRRECAKGGVHDRRASWLEFCIASVGWDGDGLGCEIVLGFVGHGAMPDSG